MTPDELASIRGRLVAHEAMIMAIGIELGLSKEKKIDIAGTALALLEAMPKAATEEVTAAMRYADRHLNTMCQIMVSTTADD